MTSPRIAHFLAATFVLTSLVSAQAPATDKTEPTVKMKTYQAVFLRQGQEKSGVDPQTTMPAHLAYLAKLNRERKNLMYGPFLGGVDHCEPVRARGGCLVALVVLDVPDAETAKRLLTDDPHVKAQKLVLDVRPWFGPEGWFHLPATPEATEPFIFGLLTRGPNRNHPPEEAEKIQAGHLAYLDQLHKAGKLVVAGPFLDDTAWRGIVIYRVPDVNAAKELAAGDPAVKAGRLVLEAHPWMTFKGIIP